MQLTLSPGDLSRYLDRQLSSMFPDNRPSSLDAVVPRVLELIELRFSRIRLTSYCENGKPTFNHLNADQYASFLYECSRVAFNLGDRLLAEKFFFLNKALNSFVCMYDTVLPNTFILIHTVGTVLGKAHYGEDLVVCHGVTVGADRGKTPHLGSGVVLFGGAAVLGAITLGDNVTVAAGTTIRNRSVPTGHVVAGSEPSPVVKQATRNLRAHYFVSPH